MRKIRLGQTNLMVSELGFGGIPIQRLSTDDAVGVVQRALDLGVTFLDSANGYSNSEERIGKAIAGRREQVVLATKSGARNLATFKEHVALSFKRLAVDHIDVLQFHNVSDEEHYQQVVTGGMLEYAQALKAEGRIGHIGVSSHNLDMAYKLVQSGHFATLMFPFCVVTPEPADKLIPLCRAHDVAFISMKPMGGGMLDNATLAFKYLRQFPDIVPLVGIQTVHEIEEIVAVMEGPAGMSAEESAEAERLRCELGSRYCRSCDYCQPCREGIGISTVLRFRSSAKRFPAERFFGDWGKAQIAKAETCAECGECEERCPYHLPIRDMLKENVIWYRGQAKS
jgi:uncharacterized protein